MTGDGQTGVTYTFDDEGHLIKATPSGGPYCYVYDGNGLRVAKIQGGTGSNCSGGTVTKLYWRSISGDSLAETDGTGSVTNTAYSEYVFFTGRRIASRVNVSSGPTPNVSIFYYFADLIGSTRTITTGSGQNADGSSQTPGLLCFDQDYTPYGQELFTTAQMSRLQTTPCPTNYKFTGYERDSETGLDYAFARYYSSRLARFLSTDPLGGAVGSLQPHNAYAYTLNNPTNLIDPLGLRECHADDFGALETFNGDCHFTGGDDTSGDGGSSLGGSGFLDATAASFINSAFGFGFLSASGNGGGGEPLVVPGFFIYVDVLAQADTITSTVFSAGSGSGGGNTSGAGGPSTAATRSRAQCAAANAASLASVLGVPDSSFLGQALLGNDISSISNLVTGNDQLDALGSQAISGPQKTSLVNEIKNGIGGIDTGRVILPGTAHIDAFGNPTFWGQALKVSEFAGFKAASKGLAFFSAFKLGFDIGAYAKAYYLCGKQQRSSITGS
ncbi:MAG TPA: RHS repeat-associated core domain-containing protein [Candidatus Acidoferrum sp.]|nr:RHS repeat-associated core domain-containing protein [Candidatus Acidoferrum sp.]